jgi:hypothetical protein
VNATFGTGADGKPRILTATKVSLPKGSVFNMAVVKRCTATQDQINAAGGLENACPPAAEIGTATAEVRPQQRRVAQRACDEGDAEDRQRRLEEEAVAADAEDLPEGQVGRERAQHLLGRRHADGEDDRSV